jgi:serine/threonine-protein kinase
MPGSAMGTAHYMSPEQAQGQELSSKSDIYSLGVTAYHLLSGNTPYSGTTPLSIAVQHVNNDIPYDRSRFGHVPDLAVYFLIAMTARDANRRPSASDVGRELRRILMQLTRSDDVRLPSIDVLTQAASTLSFAPVRTSTMQPPMQQAPMRPPGFQPPPMQRPISPPGFQPPVNPPVYQQAPMQRPPSVPQPTVPNAPVATTPQAPAFTPPPSAATPRAPQFATPSQPLPQWRPPPEEKSSNTLLYVAIAIVVIVLILSMVACGVIMQAKP